MARRASFTLLGPSRVRAFHGALGVLEARALSPIAGLALFAMMLAISGNAISRGLFNEAVGWVVPFVSSLAMPAVVFFGLPALTYHDGHVRMETVSQRLSTKAQVGVRRLGWVVGIVASGYIGYANAVGAWHRRGQGTHPDAVVPGWLQYGMTAASFLLVTLILLVYLVRPSLIPRKRSVDPAPNA